MHVKFGGHASMMPGRVRTLNPVQATVDDDGLAGNKCAVVAGKKADRASDIARSPDAFDGLLRALPTQRAAGRARSDLISGDEATTVSDVAYRWGFNHLGRFAAHYEHKFGETPSHTLRRR